jgi:hypothetical protein
MSAHTEGVWRIESSCAAASSHHDNFSNIANATGFHLVEIVGGGNCFFDAIRHGLEELGMERTVPELRLAAAIDGVAVEYGRI